MQLIKWLLIPAFILCSYTTHSVIYLTDSHDDLLKAFNNTKKDFYKRYWCAMCCLYEKAKAFKTGNENQGIQITEYPGTDFLLTDDTIILITEDDRARFFSPVGGFTLKANKSQWEDFLGYLEKEKTILFGRVTGLISIENTDYRDTSGPFWDGFNKNKPESQHFNLRMLNEDIFRNLDMRDKIKKVVVFNYAFLPSPEILGETRKDWMINILKGFSYKKEVTFDNQNHRF